MKGIGRRIVDRSPTSEERGRDPKSADEGLVRKLGVLIAKKIQMS